MNAFDAGRAIEQRSNEILLPWLGSRCADGRYVLTTKGRLARELQKTIGDVVFNPKGAPDTVVTAEVKAEERCEYGNFFLEMWSNLQGDYFTLGWFYTLNADLLLYHFLDEDELYVLHFGRLRRWAFTPCGRDSRPPLYQYPVRAQKKYSQRNLTWGACVRIDDLPDDVLLEKVHPERGDQLPPAGPSHPQPMEFDW